MTTQRQPRPLDRRRFLVAGLGAVLAACTGTSSREVARVDAEGPATPPRPTRPTPTRPDRSPAPAAGAPSDGDQPGAPGARRPAGPEPRPEVVTPAYPTGIVPASIAIPAIGVDARVIDLQLTADEVEVPTDFDEAGWWVQTRKPGEIGPAVIGGHVDSTSGPAVFFRLASLRVGDEVVVADATGGTRRFVVDTAPVQVRKDARPPEVFGFGEGRPELRLITCGGDFDPTTGHYVDNVVVFCHAPTSAS